MGGSESPCKNGDNVCLGYVIESRQDIPEAMNRYDNLLLSRMRIVHVVVFLFGMSVTKQKILPKTIGGICNGVGEHSRVKK